MVFENGNQRKLKHETLTNFGSLECCTLCIFEKIAFERRINSHESIKTNFLIIPKWICVKFKICME